ncbi:MAG: phosphatidylserine decarboxylase family protein [Cytophagaceae bacterium]|jgi:phosphatidylserine decarboxylase|nr:phosphatidylserine decarboxylase family protein [Cytophagaceae bacterium]
MSIHKEGYLILFFAFIVLLAINFVFAYFVGYRTLLVIAPLTLIFFFFLMSFFRNPKRGGFLHDKAIIAPADGKIVVIEETEETEVLKCRCIQVSIFMSVFNVHVNWFPVKGVVKYFRHHSGRYMGAYLPKSSTENERTTVHIVYNAEKSIVVRQVAGALARRIVCYAKEGDKSRQGEQMGFIKFGSRVDLYLPLDARIDVKLGQQVRGKQTVIGWME